MRPPIWQLVRTAVQELGGERNYSAIKQHVWQKYPEVNSSTLTCSIILCSVNHPSRIHYPENKKLRPCVGQYDFLFNTGRGRVVAFDPEKHGQWEIALTDQGLEVRLLQEAIAESSSAGADEAGSEFALEAHLRDFLAKNLPSLSDCGQLQLFVHSDGRDGVEFQTDVGPIDILAVAPSGDFYVFELKLTKGHDAALGQILRYMGWVKKHLCGEKCVHGVVVASDIGKKLKYAATQVSNVMLMNYTLKFQLLPTALADEV